jgi:hypothetical protein
LTRVVAVVEAGKYLVFLGLTNCAKISNFVKKSKIFKFCGKSAKFTTQFLQKKCKLTQISDADVAVAGKLLTI